MCDLEKEKIVELAKGSNRSPSVDCWLWRRLWTSYKINYAVNDGHILTFVGPETAGLRCSFFLYVFMILCISNKFNAQLLEFCIPFGDVQKRELF